MLKVIIAGSRNFDDYRFLEEKLDSIFSKQDFNEIEIISGRCNTGSLTFTTKEGINVFGTDGLGELYAERKGLKVVPFPADWNTYNQSAGPIRNRQMAAVADALILFWDGKSKGSANMLSEARKKNLAIRQCLWENK